MGQPREPVSVTFALPRPSRRPSVWSWTAAWVWKRGRLCAASLLPLRSSRAPRQALRLEQAVHNRCDESSPRGGQSLQTSSGSADSVPRPASAHTRGCPRHATAQLRRSRHNPIPPPSPDLIRRPRSSRSPAESAPAPHPAARRSPSPGTSSPHQPPPSKRIRQLAIVGHQQKPSDK